MFRRVPEIIAFSRVIIQVDIDAMGVKRRFKPLLTRGVQYFFWWFPPNATVAGVSVGQRFGRFMLPRVSISGVSCVSLALVLS